VGGTDDAPLVRESLRGNLGAFGTLYDRYARLIRAVCYDATGDLHHAEDLCQDVFLRAYRNLPALKEPNKFPGWLVGIARLVCKEWRRHRSRDPHQFNDKPPDREADLPEQSDQEELDRVLAMVSRLPEPQRLAVHLFYLQERPVEEARTVLGLSRSGFYRLLNQARNRLSRWLHCNREVN
jgi:RNA polymerase sigma-70 factor (ECF subfamily)